MCCISRLQCYAYVPYVLCARKALMRCALQKTGSRTPKLTLWPRVFETFEISQIADRYREFPTQHTQQVLTYRGYLHTVFYRLLTHTHFSRRAMSLAIHACTVLVERGLASRGL